MWYDMKASMIMDDGNQCTATNSSASRFGIVATNPLSECSTPNYPRSKQKKGTFMPLVCSAPISLPQSHIRRTHSELELEGLILRAEHEDVRMYSRLVCGMHDQIQHCVASGGYVHPLSRKSVQGIVNTKRASDQELANPEEHVINNDTNDEWDASCVSIDEPNENSMSSWSSQLSSSQGSLGSLLSLANNTEKGFQEEECVFDMEM